MTYEQKALTPEQILEAVNPPTDWSEVNTFMLVNFLRLPPQNQKDLIQSIYERKPELFAGQWKAYPETIPPTNAPVFLRFADGHCQQDHWICNGWRYTLQEPIAYLEIPAYNPEA